MKSGPKRNVVVDEITGCHVAQCALNHQGYPVYRHKGRRHSGARVVWMETRGAIPPGLQIDHLCRNRACINIAHLELVTPAENTRRAPRTKLTEDAVRTIRANPDVSHSEFGRRFGVEPDTIAFVRRGETWKDVV